MNYSEVDDKLDDEVPDFQYKIVLVGDPTVGKTSITNRYVNNTYNEN